MARSEASIAQNREACRLRHQKKTAAAKDLSIKEENKRKGNLLRQRRYREKQKELKEEMKDTVGSLPGFATADQVLNGSLQNNNSFATPSTSHSSSSQKVRSTPAPCGLENVDPRIFSATKTGREKSADFARYLEKQAEEGLRLAKEQALAYENQAKCLESGKATFEDRMEDAKRLAIFVASGAMQAADDGVARTLNYSDGDEVTQALSSLNISPEEQSPMGSPGNQTANESASSFDQSCPTQVPLPISTTGEDEELKPTVTAQKHNVGEAKQPDSSGALAAPTQNAIAGVKEDNVNGVTTSACSSVLVETVTSPEEKKGGRPAQVVNQEQLQQELSAILAQAATIGIVEAREKSLKIIQHYLLGGPIEVYDQWITQLNQHYPIYGTYASEKLTLILTQFGSSPEGREASYKFLYQIQGDLTEEQFGSIMDAIDAQYPIQPADALGQN